MKSGFDLRTGLALLVCANLIAFTQKSAWVELGWVGFLLLLLVSYGCWLAAVKFLLIFGGILCLQWYVFPVAPALIATSFSIFANYARRMLPCLMVGVLLVKRTGLRRAVLGMRKLHLPQKLIIALSVTLRYFPAIREETGHIRDAMRLRELHGGERLEALVVPLMVSATGTAEELSAAAVTRGVEDPAPKTSAMEPRLGVRDGVNAAAGLTFTILAFVVR